MDAGDPQVVNIHFPAAFSEKYIRPEVRLEIGPLASWVPSAVHPIQPYLADVFPQVFENPACGVRTIAAERTFWEKATILHQETNRQGLIPKRYSRHYYDLARLAASDIKGKALQDLGLLSEVVKFKQRFYPSQWARYERAKPGSFKLLPDGPEQLTNLAKDDEDMKIMLFGRVPSFEEILESLSALEIEVNRLESQRESVRTAGN